jgi:hypothetical protein
MGPGRTLKELFLKNIVSSNLVGFTVIKYTVGFGTNYVRLFPPIYWGSLRRELEGELINIRKNLRIGKVLN